MNAFISDLDPDLAAAHLADPHVVKMATETAQVLCTVAQGAPWPVPGVACYHPTHTRHPVTVYAQQEVPYRWWLYRHGLALCDEYAARFQRRHRAADVIEAVGRALHLDREVPTGAALAQVLARAPLAMPEACKRYDHDGQPLVDQSYRAALTDKYRAWAKSWRVATWTRTRPPHWLPLDVPRITK